LLLLILGMVFEFFHPLPKEVGVFILG